jgi:hypothetical protein
VSVVITATQPLRMATRGLWLAGVSLCREQVEDQAFGTTGCKWELEDVNAKPESTKPGVLCVFEQRGEKIKFVQFQDPGEVFAEGYAPSGAYLFMGIGVRA